MLYYTSYKTHEKDTKGIRKKFDNNIYTFDIETTSYLVLDGKVYNNLDYLKFSDEEKDNSIKCACMYIWMFGINDIVYYGRTWSEFLDFLRLLEINVSELKYVYVHNLSFEFQFLKSHLHFESVSARKSRKVMSAKLRDYNIEFRCSYMLSNCALEYIPKVFNLNVEKKVGDLDYNKLRHNRTLLTDKEMGYCEYDILVLYEYIKREREEYDDIKHIPLTSTGKVRRELKEIVKKDFRYKRLTYKAINTNPHIYNMLMDAFFGGYTHASYIWSDTILKRVNSYDETSAYPYVLVTHKFPSTEFKKSTIKKVEDMSRKCAYLLRVKFTNLKCKYYNNFISMSKCKNIKKGKYDNGRVIEAEELEITLTDVDFRFILDTYKCDYEILESYWSIYNYLPKTFINFVLDKYVAKTKYKDVEGMEVEYSKEKNKFNALYGMSVTNMIKDNVIYKDELEEWFEEELTNEEIVDKLNKEKKKSFMSFATGVWVTAWARDNLLRRVIDLDEYVCYCDTDSCKLVEGYDEEVFNKYNKSVENKIKFVSEILEIPFDRFAPSDKYGVPHMLGVFEKEIKKHQKYSYNEFITQGAKKYAYKSDDFDKKTNEIKENIHITVAGVPKDGAKALNTLDNFRDDFVFRYEDTNKHLVAYNDFQEPIIMKDYLSNDYYIEDKSGVCILPTTYVLGKSEDYVELLTDASSSRARYKEV